MSELVNNKQVDIVTCKGLTDKIRATVSAVQGTNSQLYLTVSDITFELLKRCHSSLSVNRATFILITNRIAQRMYGIYNQGSRGRTDFFRTEDKICSTRANTVYSSLKTGYGYRIGPPIAAIVNADIAAEKKFHCEAASAVASNPVETIISIIPMLSMAQLTQVAVAILAAKDDKFLDLQQTQFNKALDNPRSTQALIEELESGRSHY